MAHEFHGRVWLLGDDIDAGQILPRGVFDDPGAEVDLVQRLFPAVAPGLAARIAPGDILWAGDGFAQGGSREDVARALKEIGIRAVLATGFARIFYRNAINIGLPVAIGDPGDTRDGDELEVNLVTGKVRNVTRDQILTVEPVPRAIRPILSEGGLVPYVKAHGGLPEVG